VRKKEKCPACSKVPRSGLNFHLQDQKTLGKSPHTNRIQRKKEQSPSNAPEELYFYDPSNKKGGFRCAPTGSKAPLRTVRKTNGGTVWTKEGKGKLGCRKRLRSEGRTRK